MTWHKACTAKEFQQLVRELRDIADFPRGLRVVINRVPAKDLGDANGDVVKDGRTFRIRISDQLSHAHTAETLVHEAAHVSTWRPYTPLSEDHGPQWAVEYGCLYQRFFHVR